MNSRFAVAFFGFILATFSLAAQALVRTTNRFETLPAQPPRTGYSFTDAFPGITFDQPLVITSPPGETNRMFVVEKTGRIIVITNLAAPTRTVFLNLTTNLLSSGEQGVLGLAFHPRYAENGRLFVFRTLNTGPDGVRSPHDQLSEFRVLQNNPNAGDPASEIRLFSQFDEASNHNGGDIHFGPDGYLYVALGDEGGGNDNYANSQRIDKELFAGVLRLDVDFRAGSLPPNRQVDNPAYAWMITTNYAIPADNPYVGATNFLGRPVNPDQVHTEFWAVGLRNPWRMSFDPLTGQLWIGDVGQDRWEMVHVSRKGANHGWAFREGNVAGPRSSSAPADFLTNTAYNHVPPVHVYSHGNNTSSGNSITGGRVYRGQRITALYGAYVFADYVSGNVWSLRRNAGAPATVERLTGLNSIAGFGADPRNGDILAAQLSGGRIMRLVATPNAGDQPFPATLADTGAFSEIGNLQVSPAFTAYDVSLPFWSDYAVKQRWFHVPPGQTITFSTKNTWGSAPGTVWMKHFELETTNGVSESRRRVETRFIVRMTNGVYGITYRWNSPTNAVLVPDEGGEEEILVQTAGGPVTRRWRYPSRSQCLSCHNTTAGWSLSFNTRQLNHDYLFADGTRTNLIGALSEAGYFSNPPDHIRSLATFSEPEPSGENTAGAATSLEWRVRRYLDVNCAFCHQPGGGGGGSWDGRIATPTDSAGIIDGNVTVNFGITGARVIAPGSAERSILLNRISRRDSRGMPPIGSNETDPHGIALLNEWIQALTNRVTFTQWLGGHLGTNFVSEPSRTHDTDGDGAADYLEYLTDTNPTAADDAWRPQVISTPEGAVLRLAHPANVALKVDVADDLSLLNWQPLDAPGNEPRFLAEDSVLEIPLPTSSAFQLYRVSLVIP
jgi:glucose/arabinose dehydrogenase